MRGKSGSRLSRRRAQLPASWHRSPCGGAAGRFGRRCVRRCRSSLRGGSRRARSRWGTAIRRLRAGRLNGRSSKRSRMSNVCRSSSARCSTRAWTSPAARRGTSGRKLLVGEARTVPAHVFGQSRGARRRSDGAESLGGLGVDDPDVGEPVLKRCVEEQLAPAALRVRAESGELLATGAHGAGIESECAPADADRPEEEAVAGERCVQTARAFRERGEARISRGEPDAGTHGGDIVEVVPGALELEQDGPCTGELGGRTRGRAPPRKPGRRRLRWRRRRRRRRARRTAIPPAREKPSAARSRPRCL